MTFNLTERALTKLLAMREDPNSYLRVQVTGGGCSGMSYGLNWTSADAVTEKDTLFSIDGLLVAIDPKSGLFLDGVTLDHSDGLNGKGFEFHNPKAKRTCGCGSSFST